MKHNFALDAVAGLFVLVLAGVYLLPMTEQQRTTYIRYIFFAFLGWLTGLVLAVIGLIVSEMFYATP